MRSQIDKLVQSLDNGEAKAPLRARPDQMEFDDDNDESDEDQGNEEDNKKPKKYVPPKMMAVRYEEDEDGHETKAMEKAKRRALQSSLVQELRQQYSDAPEEFREKSQRRFDADREREKYEEDHFVRLRMSKAEKKREQRLNRDNAMDDLFNFGNYMMRDESGEALSTNKKRKGGHAGGPKGKKSRFERKKSQKSKLKSKFRSVGGRCPYRGQFQLLSCDSLRNLSSQPSMAGHFEAELCQVLIEEHFGKTVALVASTLLTEPGPLPSIIYRLKGQVKFNTGARYICGACLIVKTLYGGLAEAICEELFSYGRLTCSDTIRKVSARLEQPLADVKEKFCRLSEAQFVTRCPLVVSSLKGCPQFESAFDPFIMPEVILQGNSGEFFDFRNPQTNQESAKRSNLRVMWVFIGESTAPVLSVTFREEMTLELWSTKVLFMCQGSAGEYTAHCLSQTVRSLLKANEVRGITGCDIIQRRYRNRIELRTFVFSQSSSRVITGLIVMWVNMCRFSLTKATSLSDLEREVLLKLFDMMRCVKENDLGVERPDLEKSLRILVDDSHGVVRKSGDSGGGLYIVGMWTIIKAFLLLDKEFSILNVLLSKFVNITSKSLIREQLETRAVRISCLSSKRAIFEEDQIEKLTMMSGKETRELLYAMLEEGYIQTKPIGRTNDFAPARTFVLYYVDLPQTVRGLVEYTCKMLRNIILRRAYETKENRLLIERQVKMESIIETINADEALDEETKKQQ
ncbi:RNA polymerase III subunit RPC82, partial [Ostertagia ostertagi]